MFKKYRFLLLMIFIILATSSFVHAGKRRRLPGYVDVSSSTLTLVKSANSLRQEITFYNSSADYQVAFGTSSWALPGSFPYGGFPLSSETYMTDKDSTYSWYAIAESITIRVYFWESW